MVKKSTKIQIAVGVIIGISYPLYNNWDRLTFALENYIKAGEVQIDTNVWGSEFTSSAVSKDGIRLKTEVIYDYQVVNPNQNLIALGGDGGRTDSALAMMVSSVSRQLIRNKSLAVLKENATQIDAELESLMSEAAKEFGVGVSNVHLKVTE